MWGHARDCSGGGGWMVHAFGAHYMHTRAHLLSVEGAILASDTLANDLGVLVHEDRWLSSLHRVASVKAVVTVDSRKDTPKQKKKDAPIHPPWTQSARMTRSPATRTWRRSCIGCQKPSCKGCINFRELFAISPASVTATCDGLTPLQLPTPSTCWILSSCAN